MGQASPDVRESSNRGWEREELRPKGIGARSRVRRIAYAILLLMGLIALIGIGLSVSNYVSSIKSGQGLRLEIASLQVIDDDNPRAVIRFRIQNHSPLPVEIENYNFTLFLNGELMGTSTMTYKGTDPGVDAAVYSRAATVNQVLPGHEYLGLDFILYIYSAQMESVRRGQRSGPMGWSTDAAFRVLLPYTREVDVIRLGARYEGEG